MFVQQIRDTLHKDGFKPRKSKFRFEISDKAADFNSKILRRKKFYTYEFREKDTVIYPGYEFQYSKQLDILPGKHENWWKLKSIIDEGVG